MANLVILFLLALCPVSASAAVLYNIDCGSPSNTEFYTDDYSNVWIGDGDLIQNGVTQRVQSSNSVSSVIDTLRVFTTRKKNCYSLNGEKGGQILVRASFQYGNYDKKSSPPTFDLQFDGNEWTTVVTSNDGVVTYEAIYVTKGDLISVCVAQTKPDQFPFISALQIRSLDSSMYNKVDSNYALFLDSRVAYGADAIVSTLSIMCSSLGTRVAYDKGSPSDSYDRIWVPAETGDGQLKVTGDNSFFIVNIPDNPPLDVLQNAISTTTTSDNFILASGFPSSEVSAYFNLYFSEPTQLDTTQTRSFKIYVDNQPDTEAIIPPYQNVTEFGGNITVSSKTTLSLVATPDSTLPPLINAMEVFYISKELTEGTNSDDVEGLDLLKTSFPILQEWSGDPCLPASFNWDWLDCSTDAAPRITALHLDSFGLSGYFPDLSSMTGLEEIDLHNNSLVGPIPDFLGSLPNLKELDLADNQFSGTVPTLLTKNNKLKLDVTGNPDLCTSGKSCDATGYTPSSPGSFPTINTSSGYGKKKNKKLPVILGTTIPSGVVVLALTSFFAWIRHKRKKTPVAATGHIPGQSNGGNRPNAMGKIGEAVMNEIKVNIEEQLTAEVSDQINQQAQEYFATQNT